MKITINHSERVFIVQMGESQYFCNFGDIPNILTQIKVGETFSVFEFWNMKPKKISKKALNDMFAANNINFKVN